MKFYLWLIPSVVLYYYFYTLFSYYNNLHGGKWAWITFVYGALCPLWLIASRISKNLMFDGMLYDVTMFLTFVVTMAILGGGNDFSTANWIGVLFFTIGVILMKLPN